MSEPVNPAPRETRRYDARRRREQAAATRSDILRAAAALFDRHGYAGTTITAVAREAGVAPKTVYLAFESKSRLLRAVWDVRLRGPRDVAVADQPWYREVVEEPDPAQMLRLNARNSRRVKERAAGLLRVIRDAAPVDADAADLWALIQDDFYANQRAIAAALAEHGHLRRDLDVARATDILWTLNHPDVWQLLVGERGWSPDDFETWFGAVCQAQLLEPPPDGRAAPPRFEERGHG